MNHENQNSHKPVIVHVVESFGGGVFSFLRHVINGLAGYQHIVIYGVQRKEFPSDFETLFPWNVQFIPWVHAQREVSLIQDFKALVRLVRILKGIHSVQKIHLHSSKAGFLGRIAAFLLGMGDKVLYTPHGASFLREDISRWKKFFYIMLERFADALSGSVICCSESECEAYEKIGIRKAVFVNNSCPPLSKRSSPVRINDKLLIISSGRMTYQKNPEMFQAIAKYFAVWKNVEFLWIGGGEHEEAFCTENLSATGWVNQSQVAEIMASSDIYISTSRWEGLPISVLEAMSLGMPLLLSDCVGNCDCVKGNGFLFHSFEEATSYLEKMILDEELRGRQRLASMNLYKESFSMEKLLGGYRRLYEK